MLTYMMGFSSWIERATTESPGALDPPASQLDILTGQLEARHYLVVDPTWKPPP